MRRIAVLTNGGDEPGMNAAIREVTSCAEATPLSKVVAARASLDLRFKDWRWC